METINNRFVYANKAEKTNRTAILIKRKTAMLIFSLKGILLTSVLFLLSINLKATTISVSGSINANTSWLADTVLVTGDIIINNGYTLTIQPGTYVEFQGHFNITVEGALIAEGLPYDTIVFTKKDTTGFYDTLTLSGGWNGITLKNILNSNDSSKFRYCKFEFSNSDKDKGGLFYIENSSNMLIEQCFFENIFSKDPGGVFYIKSSDVYINKSVFKNTKSLKDGGAIAIDMLSKVTIVESEFKNCLSDMSAGAIFSRADSLKIFRSRFESCQSKGDGAVIFNDEGKFSLIESKLIYNTGQGRSGALFLRGGPVLIEKSSFEGNYTYISGGAIYISSVGAVISNSYFQYNMASQDGGAIFCEADYLMVKNNNINGNTANLNGGAVYNNKSYMTVMGNNIYNNYAYGNGGAFATQLSAGNFFISNFIRNNYTSGKGGALYAYGNSTMNIRNNVIANNQGGYGGAIYLDNGNGITYTNNTITSNNATSSADGSAIYSTASSVKMTNCIVWYNKIWSSKTIAASYSNVEGGLVGMANKNVLPEFVNPSTAVGNQFNALDAVWSLKEISPCINAGKPDTAGLSLPELDIVGSSRILNDTVDMGAYENLREGKLFIVPDSVTLCEGDSVGFQLTTSLIGITSYQWQINGKNIPGQTSSILSIPSVPLNYDGLITCEVTRLGKKIISEQAKLIVHPLPNQDITVSDPYICAGDAAAIIINGISSMDKLQLFYDISMDSASSIFFGMGSVASHQVWPDSTTVYRLKVTSMSWGCSVLIADKAVVTVSPLPDTSLYVSGDTICKGDTAQIVINNSQVNVKYQLYNDSDNSTISNQKPGNGNDLIFHVVPASYTVYRVEAVNALAGCASTLHTRAAVKVNLPPMDTTTVSDPFLCQGDTAVVEIKYSQSGINYQLYNTSEGLVGTPVAGKNGPIYFKVLTAINVIYNVVAVNPISTCKTMLLDKARITVNTLPGGNTVTLSDHALCQGDSVQIKLSNTSTSMTYRLIRQSDNVPLTPALSGTGSQLTMPWIKPSSSDSYKALITKTATGCEALSVDSSLVTVNPKPVVNLGPDFQSFCQGESVLLDAGSGMTSYLWSTNETSQKKIVNTAGVFSVTVTNAFSCKDRDTVTFSLKTKPFVSTVSPVSVAYNNSLTLNATASGVTYSWMPSSMLVNATVEDPLTVNMTTSTEFLLTVTDISTGCKNKDTVVVTVTGGPMSVDVQSLKPELCKGDTTQLKALASGGTGFYSYSWTSNPSGFSSTISNPQIHPDVTTIYYLVVTDGASTLKDSVKVIVNPLPVADAGMDKTVCEGTKVIISAAPSTHYLWSTGDTTQSTEVQPLTDIQVYLTVTDNKGCSAKDFMKVFVSPLPVVELGEDTSICTGAAVVKNIANPLIVSYNWSTGSTTSSISITNAGKYEVTVSSSLGCKAYDSILVTVNPLPTLELGPDTILCAGNTLTLDAGIGMTSYQWSTSASTQKIDVTTTGKYKVTITDGFSCKNNDSIQVQFVAVPNVSLPVVSDPSVCSGDTAVVAVNYIQAGITYQLLDGLGNPVGLPQTPATTSTILKYKVYTLSPITMSVKASSSSSCYDILTDKANISIKALPVVNLGVDRTICPGSSTTLDAGSAANLKYLWDNAQTTQQRTVSNAGTYSVKVTDTVSLCYASDQVNVTLYVKPVVNAGPDISICSNQTSITLNGTISGTYTNSYWYTSGTGSFSPDINSLAVSYLPGTTDLAQTSFLLKLKADYGTCVPVYDELIVTVTPAPELTMAADKSSLCSGDKSGIALTATVTGASGLQWNTSGNGSFQPSATSLSPVYQLGDAEIAAGSVTLSAQTTGNGSCAPVKKELSIAIENPTALFEASGHCLGDTVRFTNQSSINTGIISSYSWAMGDGKTLTSTNPAYTYQAQGNYKVVLTVTSANACVDSFIRDIEINPTPVVDFAVLSLCGSIEFTDQSTVASGDISSWLWEFGNGNISSIANPTWDVIAQGNLTGAALTVTSNKGCKNHLEKPVKTLSLPTAAFTYEPSTVSINTEVRFNDGSENASTWEWDFGDGVNTSMLQNPVFSFSKTGSYWVILTASSPDNCTDTASTLIMIASDVAVPTAFSPNNDGENDLLRVLGGPFSELDFRVFNKWGNLLFKTNSQAEGWDGSANGVDQPDGVYIYIVKGKMIDGQEIELNGNVTLIR